MSCAEGARHDRRFRRTGGGNVRFPDRSAASCRFDALDGVSTATCPLCGETYLAAATVCSDCRVALVLDPVDGRPEEAGAVEAPAWPEGDEEIAYDLDDWDAADRDVLSAGLSAERVPHEWHGDEVVVPERFADVAEELIDAIDHPDALDEDDEDDDGGAEVLSALYVASDVLHGDPGASGAVIEVIELAPGVQERPAPYGVDGRTWSAVQQATATLAALLDADGDADEVVPAAGALRAVLKTLV